MVVRLLVVSLEFCDPIFSGNGTYSRTVVDGLIQHYAASGTQCLVDVICATPQAGMTEPISFAPHVTAHAVPVPAQKWKLLDVRGPWEEFASAAAQRWPTAESLPPHDAALVVDWHGSNCFHHVVKQQSGKSRRVVYLNFRAFSNPSIVPDDAELKFYIEMESQAILRSNVCICLSGLDKELLRNLPDCQNARVEIVIPPVRDVVLSNAVLGLADKLLVPPFVSPLAEGRKYVLCCVRLVPDKNASFFVDVIDELVKSKSGLPEGLVPLLFGAAADAAYAEAVKSRLRSVCPWSIVVDSFLTSEDMAAIFCRSVLNIHPSLYDAFGLTIVEAAVCGCPSIVHKPAEGESPVGAAHLLGTSGAIYADFEQLSAKGTAEVVAGLFADPERKSLAAAAEVGGLKGRGYTSAVCGGLIAAHVQ